LKYKIKKNPSLLETKILKLDSTKARKKLKWKSFLNLEDSLNLIFEWNQLTNNYLSLQKFCEKQILNYLDKYLK